jgi:hypothetical protein
LIAALDGNSGNIVTKRSGWQFLAKRLEAVEPAVSFEAVSRLIEHPDVEAKTIMLGVTNERCLRVHDLLAQLIREDKVKLADLQENSEAYLTESSDGGNAVCAGIPALSGFVNVSKTPTSQKITHHLQGINSSLKALAQFIYMIIIWDNPQAEKLTRQEKVEIQMTIDTNSRPAIDVHLLAKALVEKHDKLKERCTSQLPSINRH